MEPVTEGRSACDARRPRRAGGRLGLLVACASLVGCEPEIQPGPFARTQQEEPMTGTYYTIGVWRVVEGREEEFVEAWGELGDVFYGLPRPPGPGTLLRSESDPSLFHSFGPWDRLEDIQAMRDDPRARAALARLLELCEEASPGTFRVVAEARPPAASP